VSIDSCLSKRCGTNNIGSRFSSREREREKEKEKERERERERESESEIEYRSSSSEGCKQTISKIGAS
jgi:hypothetical protein